MTMLKAIEDKLTKEPYNPVVTVITPAKPTDKPAKPAKPAEETAKPTDKPAKPAKTAKTAKPAEETFSLVVDTEKALYKRSAKKVLETYNSVYVVEYTATAKNSKKITKRVPLQLDRLSSNTIFLYNAVTDTCHPLDPLPPFVNAKDIEDFRKDMNFKSIEKLEVYAVTKVKE